MSVTGVPREYHEKMLPRYHSRFLKTDYEFIEWFDDFAFDEVANHGDLDGKTRFLVVLATLLGCQGIDEFHAMMSAALNFGVTPVEVKGVVYQVVAYLGVGRVFPLLKAANEVLMTRGVKLPLPGQAAATTKNWLGAGERTQMDIMGEGMKNFWKFGPGESRYINTWLTGNCFDDYYIRTGLTYQQRGTITFCFPSAQSGCEPQLVSRVGANMRIGNDKTSLIKVISQCIPYLGHPCNLDALRCVSEAAKET